MDYQPQGGWIFNSLKPTTSDWRIVDDKDLSLPVLLLFGESGHIFLKTENVSFFLLEANMEAFERQTSVHTDANSHVTYRRYCTFIQEFLHSFSTWITVIFIFCKLKWIFFFCITRETG